MTQIKVISCGHGNAYLLCGPDGAILIDTGMGKEREKVLNACGGTAVKLLLLTHGHCDHCQSARWLAERLLEFMKLYHRGPKPPAKVKRRVEGGQKPQKG